MIPDDRSAPLLDAEATEALRRGAEAFNSGKFFECHDILEEIWRGCRNPARNMIQGLIQISVGFYHLNNRNLAGGESQLSKGLENLEPYGDSYAGVELADLRRDVRTWIARICRNEKLEGELPKYILTAQENPPHHEEPGG